MRGRSCAFVVSVASVALGLATALHAPRARASGEEPSAERIKSASEEFDKGRRAYLAGDFAEAAIHFENAYHDAPRPEPLRSAIRARLAAHDDARAATLASLAAARYASDEATIALATTTLAELSGRLLGVNVACDPACGVAADGRVVSLIDATQFVFYLAPGKHELRVSWSDDRARAIAVEGGAGTMREVKLDAPPAPKPVVVEAPHIDAHPAIDARHERHKPLGPAVFLLGAGLTAAGVAATMVSGFAAERDPGVDAVKRDCVGLGSSCPEYQRGKAAELRTNVLLASTAGVGLATAVIGVFLTQWTQPGASSRGGEKSAAISPYAGGAPGAFDVGVRGAF